MWYPVRKNDGMALGWLGADTEEGAWQRLLRALSIHHACTREEAEERGYTVKFVE